MKGSAMPIHERGISGAKVRIGDRVRVQYLGLLSGGRRIDPSREREVLKFTAGGAEVISGVSFGVVGMRVGEQKRLSLTAEQAYGPVDRKLIKSVPRTRFPQGLELCVGRQLMATGVQSGRRRRVSVLEIRPDAVVVDANHPLAGEALEVELQLIALRAGDGQE
jgi:peptidylprolyl isomerase